MIIHFKKSRKREKEKVHSKQNQSKSLLFSLFHIHFRLLLLLWQNGFYSILNKSPTTILLLTIRFDICLCEHIYSKRMYAIVVSKKHFNFICYVHIVQCDRVCVNVSSLFEIALFFSLSRIVSASSVLMEYISIWIESVAIIACILTASD